MNPVMNDRIHATFVSIREMMKQNERDKSLRKIILTSCGKPDDGVAGGSDDSSLISTLLSNAETKDFLQQLFTCPDEHRFHQHGHQDSDGLNLLMKCVSSIAEVTVLTDEDFDFLFSMYENLGADALVIALRFRVTDDKVACPEATYRGMNALMMACRFADRLSLRTFQKIISLYDQYSRKLGSATDPHEAWTFRLSSPGWKGMNTFMIFLSQAKTIEYEKLKVLISAYVRRNLLREQLESRETYEGNKNSGRNPLLFAASTGINFETMSLLIASHESFIMFEKAFNANWGTDSHYRIRDIINIRGTSTEGATGELIRLGAEKCYKKSIRYWRDFDPQFQFPINDRMYKTQSLVGTSDFKGSFKNEDDDKSSCVLQ